jgi:CIC family chloride channel protein
MLEQHPIASFWEFPAFAGLGILTGIGAVLFMTLIVATEKAAARMPVKPWFRPAVDGLLVGMIALAFFPHVLGVGYSATEAALLTAFPLWLLIAVGLAKILATSVSIGFGFGGGVFSPSLVIGAMLGGPSASSPPPSFPICRRAPAPTPSSAWGR